LEEAFLRVNEPESATDVSSCLPADRGDAERVPFNGNGSGECVDGDRSVESGKARSDAVMDPKSAEREEENRK